MTFFFVYSRFWPWFQGNLFLSLILLTYFLFSISCICTYTFLYLNACIYVVHKDDKNGEIVRVVFCHLMCLLGLLIAKPFCHMFFVLIGSLSWSLFWLRFLAHVLFPLAWFVMKRPGPFSGFGPCNLWSMLWNSLTNLSLWCPGHLSFACTNIRLCVCVWVALPLLLSLS